ncbi:hypothetical protein EAF00_004923 [Botryotinia globosa]|nr:hypothetical protein EAF00_004923 [Botryotinia globosa]
MVPQRLPIIQLPLQALNSEGNMAYTCSELSKSYRKRDPDALHMQYGMKARNDISIRSLETTMIDIHLGDFSRLRHITLFLRDSASGRTCDRKFGHITPQYFARTNFDSRSQEMSLVPCITNKNIYDDVHFAAEMTGGNALDGSFGIH